MTASKHVIVTGATGLIGKALCRRLMARGDRVTVFTRRPDAARTLLPGAAQYVAWDAATGGAWESALATADAVVHLAGASIAGRRWTPAYKREIRESRTRSTRALVEAMARAAHRPSVFVCASGIDYYGPRGDELVDESFPPGRNFLAQVCVAWEGEACRAADLGVRTVMIRTGIVLDRREGALARLLLPFQLFVGGPILPGTQWWSWIHLDDEVGLIMRCIDDERASGPFNGVAPEPQRNRDFSATLGRVLGRPSWLPLPGFVLRLLLGEMAPALLIERQRAIPAKAQALGYQFAYPTLEPALRAALARPS
ncbi:MAG: TIGR01777 family oxidoreductase [Roseiflexus sp.]|nr:TIGR01777 family oxidoreductase [Roseiflexus sp.]MCS7290430.1 TIGR01777 family oxidoreductase [Roseiflexus sp.]MDW8147663.1 TIGR01777 family oxidoreductase [Roseiflexaceae bacterium]MDW8231494.1 TIGR01777 family oxidoreductase [Roseiflexaceae bacterium]